MPDFTPILRPYKEQGLFRFWTQHVLPTVYDDSLSYYELLCKVVNYLNDVIANNDIMQENIGMLAIAYNNLQDYVTHYFDNLDVQEEINSKLDAMAENGELTNLLRPIIPPVITTWLAEHITPTSPAVDSSLSVSGAAADAKAAGDLIRGKLDKALTTIPSGSDLDEVTEVGLYYIASGSAIDNCPITSGRRYMAVVQAGGVIQQILLCATSSDVFIRERVSNTWERWKDLTRDHSFYIVGGLGALGITDLNDCTACGWYTIPFSPSQANIPADVAGGMLFVFPSNATNKNLLMQVIIDRVGGKMYSRISTNAAGTAWTDWRGKDPVVDNTNVLEYTRVASNVTASNVGDKIRVMSYNVAHYDNDTTTFIPDGKLVNLKKMIGNVGADLLGLQEEGQYIDASNTQLASAYIYNPLYVKKYGEGGSCIYSKSAATSGGLYSLTSGRSVRWSIFPVKNNKTLFFGSFHATPGDDQIATRSQEYGELISFANSKNTNYVIIAGDYNSKSATDHTNLANACRTNGYSLANGGWLGWIKTHKNSVALDNVIVNANCIINNVQALETEYDKLYSDHFPLVVDVTLLD